MRLADEVRIQLKGMNPVERESAVRELREVIYEDAYETIASRDDVLACPRCGSIGIVRKGHNPDGSQRWQCRDCRRTFSKTRDTLIGRSKLPVAKWMMYVECFVDCLALRTCASRCEVSLRTAWLMRRRLLKCLERYLPKFVAGAGVSVQLDETYLRESFKGNHTKGKFVMPRTARHRGASLHKRGLGREQICIMTGVSDSDTAFAILSGRGVISKQRAIEALDGRILHGAHVMADTAAAYPGALEALGTVFEQVDAKSHRINRINTLHSNLDGFLHGFKGVSTKHLQSYLTWFLWRRSFRDDRNDSIIRQVDAQPCPGVTRDWNGIMPPYMEYWAWRHRLQVHCTYPILQGKGERHGEHAHHDHAPRPRTQGPGHEGAGAIGAEHDRSRHHLPQSRSTRKRDAIRT
mgnify:FL=1